ncbi:hypothetical protein [Algoriphagus halophytocola]|uniref:DUF4760 domain-containing protein n=1 Tax=Algoriphagus halophytocola TaxID=2991499 RepID=A0ABY6MGQ0_9BACT|nr:hypothetical protein [Algoriphagus sp. TR-M5]UZD22973.1 hypothetical protein OM944_00460 [Algoriphagus sp. TR-M5]
MMEILDLLTEFWSQITVLIIGIGYILRTIFNFYLKRAELKFAFIHKERAEVIREIHIDLTKLSRDIDFLALGHTFAGLKAGPSIEEGRSIVGNVVDMKNKIKIKVEENEIYFSDNFISLFNQLFSKIDDNVILTSLNNSISNCDNEKYEFNNSGLFLSYYETDFPKLKHKLKKEYRKYL